MKLFMSIWPDLLNSSTFRRVMRAYFFTSSWIIVEGVEGGVKGSEIRSRRGERPCSFSTRGTYFSAVNRDGC